MYPEGFRGWSPNCIRQTVKIPGTGLRTAGGLQIRPPSAVSLLRRTGDTVECNSALRATHFKSYPYRWRLRFFVPLLKGIALFKDRTRLFLPVASGLKFDAMRHGWTINSPFRMVCRVLSVSRIRRLIQSAMSSTRTGRRFTCTKSNDTHRTNS